MNFAIWLESQHEHKDDEYEDLIATTVYNFIVKSVQEYFASNRTKRLSEIMVNLGRGNVKMKNLGSAALPRPAVTVSIPSVIRGIKLPQHFIDLQIEARIIPVSKNIKATYGSGVIEVGLNVDTIAKASDFSDQNLQAMLVRLEYQLHHECTHISSGRPKDNATEYGNVYLMQSEPRGTAGYNQAKIDYYTDPGELRAHAKQYAVLYARFFPGQPFDRNKMMMLQSYSDKIDRYFQGLHEKPGISSIWGMDTRPYANQLNKAAIAFEEFVKYFLSKRP